MALKVLVSAPYMQPVIQRFRSQFDQRGIELVVPEVNERMEEEELLQAMADIDGVISGDDRFTPRVLKASTKLRVISKWGTGIDSIDLEACRELGIRVCNTPDAFSIPVADSVLGYMLCFARKLPWMDRQMRSGVWEKIPGSALHENILGVIGVGDVGKAVVKRAVAMGMTVLGNDLVEMPSHFISETAIRMMSKEDLLAEADFVSLNCDLNPTSYHLMDRNRFSRMKSSAVLINAARGPIVKEEDLIQALLDKTIGGAALDVFEHEPLPEESLLKTMDNVMLAPHNANSSPQAWEAVHQKTIDNLFAVLVGEDS